MVPETRLLKSAAPRHLTLVDAAARGEGADRGLNFVAGEGLLKRILGGY